MKILTQNATALLFEKVNSLRHQHDSWRCIQLKLSGISYHNQALRRNFVLRGIHDLLAENDGFVYACEDQDIFILFQGRTKNILTKLATYFADIDSDNLFALYDLHKDWAFFFSVCYRKSHQHEEEWYNKNISDRLASHNIPVN